MELLGAELLADRNGFLKNVARTLPVAAREFDEAENVFDVAVDDGRLHLLEHLSRAFRGFARGVEIVAHAIQPRETIEHLRDIDRRLTHVYTEVTDTTLGTARMAKLNEAVNTLVPLRKAVAELTTWPFRDTVAFGRAVLIASAPLVYAVLNELIRVFWIAPLSR